MNYAPRILSSKIKELAKHFPAIVLTGARQVGKTTLLCHAFPEAELITFDSVVDVGNARQDPELFLKQLKLPVILDEVQYAPEILSVLKRHIDVDRRNGQYWLTGSQQFSVLKNIAESMAGRAAVLSLWPLSLGEVAYHPSVWIHRFLENPETFVKQPQERVPSSQTLIQQLWRGGYPGLLSQTDEWVPITLTSYLRTYLERDVRLLSDIAELQEFNRFLQLMAQLSGQEINFSQLGRDIHLSPGTAKRWLNILVGSYQWINIPPFVRNSIKRISGKNKGYFADTGLLCQLLYLAKPQALLGHPKLGAIFESFIVQDIIKQLSLTPDQVGLYHWRAYSGAEVDLILESNDCFIPIEIKCKSRPTPQDCRGILSFREAHPKLNIGPGLVIAPVEKLLPLGNNCFAIPYDLA